MADPSDADLADLAAAFYEAALDPALWPGVLERVRTAFGAMAVVASGYDLSRMQGFLFDAGSDPAAIESYTAHYVRTDPLVAPLIRHPPGRVFSYETLMPKAAFLRTEFCNDWVRPQGIGHALYALSVRDGPLVGGFGMTRGRHQAEFDGRTAAALEALLPQLGRAVRTTWRLAAAEARGAGMEALLCRLPQAALLLAADGTVLYANPAAEALLRRGDGLTTARGRLCAARPCDDAAFRRALAGAAAANGGETLAVERPSGRAPLAVTVQPTPTGRRVSASDPWRIVPMPAALVFVADPDRTGGAGTARVLRTLYGLTSAEAVVTEAIAQGQGVADAAEALGVAPSTLRWHLKNVFGKTGTTRQAELARLVERLGAAGEATTASREPL